MLSLTDLPPELIHHTVSFLRPYETPSRYHLHEEPSKLLSSSTHQPLKKLSQTCRFLHDLCFPYIFSALKANIEDISSFAAFVQSHDLVEKVESLMICSIESRTRALTDGSLKPDQVFSKPNWTRFFAVLDTISPRSLTLVLPPAAYEYLLPYKLNLKDTWAFNIAHQVLHLDQGLDTVQPSSTARPTTIPNIFCSRPWSHVTFNEGSSIPAYSTYEYFHKKTPSLLLPQQNWMFPIDMSARLTSFDLIGVFPFGHTASTCAFLFSMKSLRRLRTQLAPGVNNRIMDDPKALGKCQREDLWSEFEWTYQALSGTISQGQLQGQFGQFEEFVALDYAILGLREMIDRCVGFESGYWEFDDQGSWRRIGP